MLVIIGLKVVMLSLAWKLKAEQMGFFTLSEWVRGMTELQYETSDFDVWSVYSIAWNDYILTGIQTFTPEAPSCPQTFTLIAPGYNYLYIKKLASNI